MRVPFGGALQTAQGGAPNCLGDSLKSVPVAASTNRAPQRVGGGAMVPLYGYPGGGMAYQIALLYPRDATRHLLSGLSNVRPNNMLGSAHCSQRTPRVGAGSVSKVASP